jgi:hypothetical protein
LEKVEAEHTYLLIVQPIAGDLAAAGEVDEALGAVPILDDIKPFVNFAPESR